MCASQPRARVEHPEDRQPPPPARAMRLAIGTIRRTESWAGLTIGLSWRVAPPCSTRTTASGFFGTRVASNLAELTGTARSLGRHRGVHHDVLDVRVVALAGLVDHAVPQPRGAVLGMGGDDQVVGPELAHGLVEREQRR